MTPILLFYFFYVFHKTLKIQLYNQRWGEENFNVSLNSWVIKSHRDTQERQEGKWSVFLEYTH